MRNFVEYAMKVGVLKNFFRHVIVPEVLVFYTFPVYKDGWDYQIKHVVSFVVSNSN
jgi:hypothetical protein